MGDATRSLWPHAAGRGRGRQSSCEQLNQVVIEQGKLLDRLKKEIQRQSSAMRALELERIQSNAHKPPHYQ
jgi:uncharacterized coiled-coil protein SlyX